jgi:hypothetical protein
VVVLVVGLVILAVLVVEEPMETKPEALGIRLAQAHHKVITVEQVDHNQERMVAVEVVVVVQLAVLGLLVLVVQVEMVQHHLSQVLA